MGIGARRSQGQAACILAGRSHGAGRHDRLFWGDHGVRHGPWGSVGSASSYGRAGEHRSGGKWRPWHTWLHQCEKTNLYDYGTNVSLAVRWLRQGNRVGWSRISLISWILPRPSWKWRSFDPRSHDWSEPNRGGGGGGILSSDREGRVKAGAISW